MSKRLFWQSSNSVVWTAVVLFLLAALRCLDQTFAQAGLWLFAGLTLTTGFFHGALDIVLLQREFVGARQLAGVLFLYVAAAVSLAILCVNSNWLMVLTLLLMSAWHFGEPYGRWGHSLPRPLMLLQRLVAGGGPVMLPALLSSSALQAVMPLAVGGEAAPVWLLWQTLAWCWVALCGLGVALLRQRLFSKPFIVELVLIFIANFLLSPLVAFSIYFGVLHSSAYIFRVLAKRRCPTIHSHGDSSVPQTQPFAAAVIITSAATLLLLVTLGWYLSSTLSTWAEYGGVLNGLLVALTALTLPHLVLVSRNADWLATQPVTSLLAARK